jgi:lipid A disaccharide synthetase
MVKLPSEQKRVRFYLVTFLILVILGTFSLETAAVGTPAVYAKKHTATAESNE